MGLALVQKQALKLKMAPALFQSVTLLQFSNEQLSDYIMGKAMENPLLNAERSDFRPAGQEFVSSFTQAGDGSRSTSDVIEETVASSSDYHEMLHNDLHQLHLDRICMAAADLLIDNLNDKGYFDDDPVELLNGYGLDPKVPEMALEAVQSLDPAGVGARTLSECILLQLKRMIPAQSLAERIISEHSDFFLSGSWDELAERLETTEKKIQAAVGVIRGLSPSPVSSIQDEAPQYIIPDVTIKKSGDGLSCELEDQYLPKIELDSRNYESYLESADSETRRYLREKKEEADWLIAGISRRKQTLMQLTEMLMKEQQVYFENGNHDLLRPFTMKNAAERLSVNESTVSRAVANKYIQTPYGMFPMKKFFVRAVKTIHGEVSSFQILSRIKYWIGREDRADPFSDQKLVQLLSDDGLHCSRRAIAKYRQASGIGSTVQRRSR
ncbi:RNA polymerase factor sigma-54 [Sporolactobacillus pectinivorans]|uniref:RNA polymerase factor sigma-54 n=1 Tax=Sporolactobacillus pectinivorans TaxID=1591408 RepID=UPI000C267940|nr:RNA polymerase factor sigma-54 [Sporolactobacillus pectinivorans]